MFKKWELLLLGFLGSFFSAPGQTYLIAIFNDYLQESAQISQTTIASIYALATLCAAFLLPFLGRLLDKVSLSRFILLQLIGLSITCYIFGQADSIMLIFLAYLGMRSLAHGTLSLIGRTIISIGFSKNRGKALAFASLGYPLAECTYPILVVLAVQRFGRENTWNFLSAYYGLLALPLLFFLAKQIEKKYKKATKNIELLEEKQWKVSEIVRTRKFYLLLPAWIFPPFVITSLFFHQTSLVAKKEWSVELLASGFIAFGILRAIGSIGIGPLIDRFTARRLLYFYLFPMLLGIAFLIYGMDPIFSFCYLGLLGFTVGVGGNIKTALLPDLYGTKNMGAIQGFMSAALTFSTAISPPILGFLLDQNIDLKTILFTYIAAGFVATALIWPGLRK